MSGHECLGKAVSNFFVASPDLTALFFVRISSFKYRISNFRVTGKFPKVPVFVASLTALSALHIFYSDFQTKEIFPIHLETGMQVTHVNIVYKWYQRAVSDPQIVIVAVILLAGFFVMFILFLFVCVADV